MPAVAPLLLFFETNPDDLSGRLSSLISENGPIFPSCPVDSGGQNLTVLFEGVSLQLACKAPASEYGTIRPVFTNFAISAAKSVIEIDLHEHVAGGQRIAPVARALLAAGGFIAKALDAGAVLWRPANIVSETDFYTESVLSYANGGAFPVLSTVHFEYDDSRGAVSTDGLAWFSGQELRLDCEAPVLGRSELMKRAVRLVHDIAVNGPVLEAQEIDDLGPAGHLVLMPDRSAALVAAEIRSAAGAA